MQGLIAFKAQMRLSPDGSSARATNVIFVTTPRSIVFSELADTGGIYRIEL